MQYCLQLFLIQEEFILLAVMSNVGVLDKHDTRTLIQFKDVILPA